MNTELRELILKLIEKNSRLEIRDLAVMLDVPETEIANEIADMEKEHIICGYHTVINWDNTGKDQLTAMIEVKKLLRKTARDLIRSRSGSTTSLR